MIYINHIPQVFVVFMAELIFFSSLKTKNVSTAMCVYSNVCVQQCVCTAMCVYSNVCVQYICLVLEVVLHNDYKR